MKELTWEDRYVLHKEDTQRETSLTLAMIPDATRLRDTDGQVNLQASLVVSIRKLLDDNECLKRELGAIAVALQDAKTLDEVRATVFAGGK